MIYMTDDIPEAWINYFQGQLNLPKSCFYIHRIRDGLNGDEVPFEINKLYEQITKDHEDATKEPVIIIGTAGTEGGLDDKVLFSFMTIYQVTGGFRCLDFDLVFFLLYVYYY